MSGQLIGGIAGAAIGSLFGGVGASVGWMIGSMAGGLLFPAKNEGPRLNDNKMRGANYGTPRPILYGCMRVGGIGAGQGSTSEGPNKFTEHKEKTGGKGGAPSNYTYSLSFFNEICEGPIGGVRRRWANNRLVTDETSTAGWPYRLHQGTPTQMPDPTMETVYGVGEVTPLRGVAYESVEELPLADYGNARPEVEYEAYTATGEYPWRVSTFNPWPESSSHVNVGGKMVDGVITTSYYTSVAAHYYEHQYLLDGTDLEMDVDTPIYFAVTGEGFLQTVVLQLSGVAVYNSHNHASFFGWYKDATASIELIGTVPHATQGSIYQGRQCYSYAGGDVLSYAMIDGDPDPYATAPNATYTLDEVYSDSAVMLGTSDDGHVWVAAEDKLWKFDLNLELVHFWPSGSLPSIVDNLTLYPFHVYKNQLVFDDDGLPRIKSVVRVNEDWTFTYIGSVVAAAGPCITLSAGLVLVSDGVISLDPPIIPAILGDIVSDLLQRGGCDPADIDVSDLTQEVPGFLVASQMTIHNAIDALRKGYFFDVTEYDGKIVARNRGHDAIATIPDGDLNARAAGEESQDPLSVTRTPESELPRTVFVRYYDREHDYQPGSQYQRRQVTSSQADVSLDLPLALNATEALQVAQWHLHFAWLEREHFEWTTSIKWSALTPTDVVVVRGVSIRITNKTETPDGLIKFEGVRAFGGPFAPSSGTPSGTVGGSGPGAQDPPTPPGLPVPTELVLLDIPVLTQDAAPFGFYAAMGPAHDGKWTGATLYKSGDDGATWVICAEATTASTIGATADALADYVGPIDDIDETSTVDVVLTLEDSTLASVDEAALATGANLCAIRSGSTWELLQFRDAVLTAPGAYTLSGLLRGRLDSAAAIAGHAVGDDFVLLATAINVDAPEIELDVPLLYKAVTYGTDLADAIPVEFTNTGKGSDTWHATVANNLPIFRVDHTGTSHTFVETDHGKLHAFDNAGTVTVGLPGGLKDGWWVFIENVGAGDLVLDPAGSPVVTIDGSTSSLTLETGQGVFLQTDGVNFGTSRGLGSGGSGSPGGGGGFDVEDEGVPVGTGFTILDVVGSTLQAIDSGGGRVALVGTGKVVVKNDGVVVGSAAFPNLDFLSPFVVTDAGAGVAQIEVGSPSGGGSGGGSSQAQAFTASGTFNVPLTVSMVKATMVGGGGGGSSRITAANGGAGGGAGEYVFEFPQKVTPGAAMSVTIGAGGGGAPSAGIAIAGTDGGVTTFGSASVQGGKGGTALSAGGVGGGTGGGAGGATNTTGGIGSLGAVETQLHSGGWGGSGGTNAAGSGGAGRAPPGASAGAAGGVAAGGQGGGGAGASTIYGIGGAGGNGGAVGGDAPSTSYGAGGGGAGGKATTSMDGGDGAPGYVLLTWFE